MTTARTLHWVSTVLLAVGFLGVGALMYDASYGPEGGGANIGLGLVLVPCLGSGVVGLALGAATLVARWWGTRAERSRTAVR
ncbi:hypothetical protein BIV02_16905 [Curtobacterium sp. MMLR14_014]|uniref:hypothetical protein n=1 Tax=unclassified Curtobacterium TaxID=257496 RepID=UPI0008F8CDE9|nr:MULTISPECIES: hypothetical protein [unclassified Curtobacterium]OII38090.1 hypothetical protein BIU91_10005 [Curtobacterium sp. MMLR14_002]OII44418.1 hypothetical protein BIV02_16905 [Curtobacterium sp. MMLR14_014]